MHYPVVDDEELRLDALRSLAIIGTPPTAAFDAIANIVADVFSCPIAFISLLDQDQQWFKAQCGLGISSTLREVAFCNYTLLGTEVFVVEDALLDARFAQNPMVTGAMGIRFYAGVPITTESGFRIGALCVNDTRPRQFSDVEKARLQRFGKIVEELVAAHTQSVRAAESAQVITEKAQLLWKKTRLLRQMERIGKIGGWEFDIASNTVDWSDEVFRIHELPVGDPCSLEEALSFYPAERRSYLRACVETAIATGEGYTFDSEFVTALGREKWVRASAECEHQDGKPVRLFGMFQDITQEKAASTLLWRAANFDEVTGLANRRHFNQLLADVIAEARTSGRSMNLMILDLDNFKQINDTRGHAVGDEILTEVGSRLARAVPDDWSVARLGGDEFAIITSDCSTQRIESNCREILDSLKAPVCIGPNHIYISGTMGAARFPNDATSAPELLKCADLGLYAAKNGNRGSTSFYSPNLTANFERHSRAADLVRNALARGLLVPFYQPKVQLGNAGLWGFEALARIQEADGNVIGAEAFATAFEDRDLARAIGDKMLRAVTADIASWREAGLDPKSVSLNINEADFAGGELAQRVLRRLDELAIPTSCLTIEVTESAFLGDEVGLAQVALDQLDAEGVKIELDDFGTGYASLTHLRSFPVNRLKIDRSFIEDLGTNDGARAIVQAVIDLGHNLDCEVIAEGVETELQAELLRDMGCDAGQGFLFGRPANAEAARKLLLARAEAMQHLLSTIAARHAAAEPVQACREPEAKASSIRRS